MKQCDFHNCQAHDIPGVLNQPTWMKFTQRLSKQLGIGHAAHLICSLYSTWLFIAYLGPETVSFGASLKLNQKDK